MLGLKLIDVSVVPGIILVYSFAFMKIQLLLLFGFW